VVPVTEAQNQPPNHQTNATESNPTTPTTNEGAIETLTPNDEQMLLQQINETL
jgi:hypothetical protein